MKRIPLEVKGLHPSFLALDRASLGQAQPEVSAHLGACGECRAHVESLSQLSAAADFASVQRAIERRPRFSLAWVSSSVALVATACAVLLLMTHHAPSVGGSEETYVGAKGFRSVWIYVNRGAETQLWDGKGALTTGDRIRLKIDPGSYHHVQVYSLSDPRNPVSLFEGPLAPGQNLTLPEAWEIDDSSSPEELLVAFSDAPVQPSWQDWRLGRAEPGVAILRFTLPKTNSAQTEAGPFSP